MEAKVSGPATERPNPDESLDDPTDRFADLLALPRADPEVRDIAALLFSALESAWQTDVTGLLDDALGFAHGRLTVRGLTDAGPEEIGAALEAAAPAPLVPEDEARIHSLLARCLPDPAAAGTPGAADLDPLAAAYVAHLVRGDRKGAVALVRRCVTDGMDIYDVLLDILEPAQHDVGRRWALGLISVAQEHFCTAVTQFVMTDLYPGLFSGVESQRRLVAVHVPGSLHHVGLRMVVDVLECRDWSTTYLVDDITVESLPERVAEEEADLLLISASMPGHIPHVTAMIRAVREDPRTQGVKVVVGGRPFHVAPDLVGAVGADGWAPDARTAVDVCDALVGGDRAQHQRDK